MLLHELRESGYGRIEQPAQPEAGLRDGVFSLALHLGRLATVHDTDRAAPNRVALAALA